MKLNLKRIAMGLTMAVCLLSFSINSKAETAPQQVDPNAQSQLEQIAEPFLQMFVDLKDEDVEKFKTQAEQAAIFSKAADSWKSLKPELGELVSIGDDVKITTTPEGYSATVNAVFEKKSITFTVAMDSTLTKIVSVDFTPEKSANSQEDLYGWLAVGAIVLVLAIIGVRKFNGGSKDSSSEESSTNAPAAVSSAPQEGTASQAEVNLMDDMELVIVLIAAIAASTGSSPSGLVVRSIKRAPASKWKNA
ncbi:DUF3887 domain-containing protein [Lacrimispora algidixylanolytica]|uniref:Uncharacterized protein n=1 Tax=Lacrimispora algidixylanolytica TaxID=94868 RepID=A0A419T0H8_9FIRM|nr:DUF3887 domain-containing protein [Lacrimispora algidixylanolytica]RKD30975.1 hypothetical protein BET01_03715 [Lacrimispora algidixylanolytica]